MTEPVVTYTLRESLDRIERKLDGLAGRVESLERSSATASAVRRALWAASGSPLVAGAVAWLLARH